MRIDISKKNLLDIVNIKYKVFNPLNKFMSKDDIISVVENFKLSNNTFFPLPIYLDIDTSLLKKFIKSDSLNLYFNKIRVCNLSVFSIFELESKKKLGSKIFNTTDQFHPGYKNFLKSKKYFVEGKIENFNNRILKMISFSSPENVVSKIKKSGLKNVAAFHTRNVPHKGHEWIHNYALKKCDGLLIHPLIGQFLKNEYRENIIINSNKKLIKNIYKNKKIFLEFFNSYPRYAGPREAMFHALVRRNYGCSHFLVGRDHAGALNRYGKNYYKKYASQKLCLKYQSKLKIKIISFNEPYFCEVCRNITNGCNHSTKMRITISGVKIRNLILKNKKIPEIYMSRQISKSLTKKSII